MTDRLTPERENEIRKWNAGMVAANPECAEGCEFADFGDCEVCTPRILLAELDACRRDLAEERARTSRLTDVLLALSSPSKRQRLDQGRGVTHYIREALRECGAGTEQPA